MVLSFLYLFKISFHCIPPILRYDYLFNPFFLKHISNNVVSWLRILPKQLAKYNYQGETKYDLQVEDFYWDDVHDINNWLTYVA